MVKPTAEEWTIARSCVERLRAQLMRTEPYAVKDIELCDAMLEHLNDDVDLVFKDTDETNLYNLLS
jgi:hypothetical protein